MLVTLKAAATLDGKIATASGHSKWISAVAARQKGHELRHEHEAILVGINTVLADNPQLTVRRISVGRSPVRIVLDSKGRIPEQSKVFQNDGVPVVIVTGNQAVSRIWPDLPSLKILAAPSKIPEVEWLLAELSGMGLQSVLVEGGSRVHASFLKSGCVDRLALFLSPKIFGGQKALSWCGDLGVSEIDDAPRWEIESVSSVGEDLLISAKNRNVRYGR